MSQYVLKIYCSAISLFDRFQPRSCAASRLKINHPLQPQRRGLFRGLLTIALLTSAYLSSKMTALEAPYNSRGRDSFQPASTRKESPEAASQEPEAGGCNPHTTFRIDSEDSDRSLQLIVKQPAHAAGRDLAHVESSNRPYMTESDHPTPIPYNSVPVIPRNINTTSMAYYDNLAPSKIMHKNRRRNEAFGRDMHAAASMGLEATVKPGHTPVKCNNGITK
ncbi:uncharacterized protein BDR25DRAFT_391980 [Lindgomyces ingoldianus]|uniref:Uncharacterized protein n=1 Tax=Lindgomyces ingoldianus TaxID=673940 RepID=A0ACB6R4J5_9PLEO|nr:uncharacterized protein BDR25DRAFT_391980 [Lindgomyces ingoldianus]KAF2474179.1 hypothetical protein BDR25DRAFT_391980 [Lindgomyces ingoldianus]